jgi:hypothetical protein
VIHELTKRPFFISYGDKTEATNFSLMASMVMFAYAIDSSSIQYLSSLLIDLNLAAGAFSRVRRGIIAQGNGLSKISHSTA